FFLLLPPPPTLTLFPYTTLFRSREYTLNRDVNLQWLNPVLAYLVPQRSTLFGFSLALILFVVLWIAVRNRLGWRPFIFAGVVAGDRKSTRLNSSHVSISYAVFCL